MLDLRAAAPFHLIAELDGGDMASLQRGYASPLGQEASRDVDNLARLCPGVHSMVFELESTLTLTTG